MTTTDYLINIVLVAFVILQVKGGRLTLKTALRPVICVAAAAVYYLQGIPTAGNDVLLTSLRCLVRATTTVRRLDTSSTPPGTGLAAERCRGRDWPARSRERDRPLGRLWARSLSRRRRRRSTEAINNLIKRIKRVGFGFRNFENYRIRALLYAGKPNWRVLGSIVVR